MHGLDRFLILLDHRFQTSAALIYIPLDPSANANIRISIHIDLDIHQIPQFFVLKDQNTFHNDDPLRFDAHSLIAAVVDSKVINRTEDLLTVF